MLTGILVTAEITAITIVITACNINSFISFKNSFSRYRSLQVLGKNLMKSDIKLFLCSKSEIKDMRRNPISNLTKLILVNRNIIDKGNTVMEI